MPALAVRTPPRQAASGRADPTVATAVLTLARLSDVATTVGDLRRLFEDPHVHAAVVVQDGVLVTVVEPDDLLPGHRDDEPAVHLGRHRARIVAPAADLEQTRLRMLATGRRRLAVVDAGGIFLGLLCLKRTGTGFCSDRDVLARRRDPRGGTSPR